MSPLDDLARQIERAEEAGVILECMDGIPTWEAFPSPIHQQRLFDIAYRLRTEATKSEGPCGCHVYLDMYIRFGESSFKRPDISIFCDPVPETREAANVVPEGVIELLSPGYEKKDLELGVPFYLSHGVKDVIVVDPESTKVLHFDASQKRCLLYTSPSPRD